MMNAVSHDFFRKVKIEQLDTNNFEERLKNHEQELVGVFFWGHDCPNCEIAKARLSDEANAMNTCGLKWFHINTYENFELGTRFGLFGIPTFLFFYQGKKLGRISPFPGVQAFFEAIAGLREKTIGNVKLP